MYKATREWDVRCSKVIRKEFHLPGKAYYWKINQKQAVRLCNLLSILYNIEPPNVEVNSKLLRMNNCNGTYDPRRRRTIIMYSVNHLKTIAHEFYHHLDHETNGAYNSSDNKRLRYAHKFADLWFDALRGR